MSSYREKLLSLSFGSPSVRQTPRSTTDERGHVTTEHWNDRVDVTINAPRLALSSTITEEK